MKHTIYAKIFIGLCPANFFFIFFFSTENCKYVHYKKIADD